MEQDAHRRGIVIGARAARDRVVMGAQDEDAVARPDLDGVGLALSFAAREGMTAERDAAVLEVAGHGGLTARRVPADQEAGEVPGRVIAREHLLERRGRRHGPGRAAVQQPPDRAQDESKEAKGPAQRAVEERHGCSRGAAERWGVGGHVWAPHSVEHDDAAGDLAAAHRREALVDLVERVGPAHQLVDLEAPVEVEIDELREVDIGVHGAVLVP